MVLAFLHFITPPFLIKIFGRAKKISPRMLFFAAIGGLFPDLDYFWIWILNLIRSEPISFAHRSLFHNVFFIGLLFVLVLVLYSQNNRYTKYILALTFGIIIHIGWDMIDIAVPLFYPVLQDVYGLYLFDFKLRKTFLIMTDTILFTIWVTYLTITGRLSRIL